MTGRPILLWFRRDLRLADHPMLHAAAQTGRPIIPVVILDPVAESWGAASRWRWGEGVRVFAGTLADRGLRLILRRGDAAQVLSRLVAETGAEAVWWSRAYDPGARTRDIAVKAALRAVGTAARSFPGQLLFEPDAVATGQGTGFKVFSAWWRAAQRLDPGRPLPAPGALAPPHDWPASDDLDDWRLGAALRTGEAVLRRYSHPGEGAALARLSGFLEHRLANYADRRDFPADDAASGLSEYLAHGEISPRTIWTETGWTETGRAGGNAKFLSELGWREFAYHLLHHAPQMATRNWNPDWDRFPWLGDNADAEAWRRGMTGEPFVDAALRELFVTGRVHNRARMVAASYLTKHLLTDWRIGLAWFADCLTDWDPAANALGWQWVAGSGPDAAPYFRVFNPVAQAEKFDPGGAYRRRWIAEGQTAPTDDALAFFKAAPRSWALDPRAAYPARRVEPAMGRQIALDAYAKWKTLKLLP